MSITMFWLQVFLYISLGLVVLFVIQEFLIDEIKKRTEKRPMWEPRRKED